MASFGKKLKDWFTGQWLKEGPVRAGGQAVMEGVMMRAPEYTAIAVRDQQGNIRLKRTKNTSVTAKYPVLGWPIIRGVVNFILMLYGGMKTLMDSAEMAGEEIEEPNKFEKKMAEIFHVKPDDVMMTCAVILALVFAIGLFFVVPTLIESLLKKLIADKFIVNLLGGVVRMIIFLVYVYLCSKLKEIRRVFQYHGAEHKTVYCLENEKPLTIENCKPFTTLHPRCGTSFLVIVMLLSILVFTLLGKDTTNVFSRVGSRLLLLPLVAGISYDLLQWLGRARENGFVRALKWPGLQVQRLTTAEPDESMLEVAIVSLKYAMDQKDLTSHLHEGTKLIYVDAHNKPIETPDGEIK